MTNSINYDYKKIECIARMDEKHLYAINQLVEEYAPRLLNRIIINNSVFTLHNFNEHCFDIYKIISDVLLDSNLIFSGKYSLSQTELYILNLAVLFHDIGMSESYIVGREDHSIRSAEFIEKEWENKVSVFAKCCLLNDNEIEALKYIIIAHSDIKNGSIPPEENGLYSSNLDKKIWDRNSKLIRTRFLAGVLRVADELDITSERLGNSNIEQEIEFWVKRIKINNKPEEIQIANSMLESLNYWKRLHLISYVKRDNSNETICIYINDKVAKNTYCAGESWDSIADCLVLILSEVEKKLREASELCFSKSELKKSIAVHSVQLITEISELQIIIEKALSRRSFSRNKINVISESVDTDGNKLKQESKKTIPYVIDKDIEILLSKEVEKRKLLCFGHFRLTSKLCARDWINTKELVETRSINSKIVKAICMDINNKQNGDDYVVVGVGLVGTIVASRVAFSLHCPLSYIITEKDEINNSNQETQIYLPDGKKIILITDVVVTFESIIRLMELHSFSERVISIYSLFYRKNEEIKNERIVSITRCLNAKYDIELFERKNCKYKEKCIAVNQTINSINEIE